MPTLAYNKYVRSDYDVLEEFEAGLVLTGAEVKSTKLGHVKLQGSYVAMVGQELWLKKAFISPYQASNQRGYEPLRDRKVLLKGSEIISLIGKTKEAGLTLLPESLYSTRRLVKLKLLLVRGKKKHDKRAAIKKRDVDRQIARALRQKV